MNDLDALFKEMNSASLTAKIPTTISGRKLRGKNELPLMSQAVANAIATSAWAISSPQGQKNIQRTIENSVKRKFLPYVNAMATANRKSLHHVYEWEKVGVTSGRLFDLKIPANSRGRANFSMRLEFRPSKKLVPLTQAQMTPNPDTGQVVERRHIFYNKAMVMEYGQKVVVKPKISKYLAFDNPAYSAGVNVDPLSFTSKPITIDYAKMQTAGALQKTVVSFFSSVGKNEINRNMQEYGQKVSRASEKSSVFLTVSTPSDAYAQSIGQKMAGVLNPIG